MTRTLTRTYDSYETARSVVERLEASGVSSSDISFVGRVSGEAEYAPSSGSDAHSFDYGTPMHWRMLHSPGLGRRSETKRNRPRSSLVERLTPRLK